MFTGIVEEKGRIKRILKGKEAIEIMIEGKTVLTDVKLGDSISVNGVCLTVTDYNPTYFSVDVMPETVKATSLNGLKEGSYVNLERAMPANGRFGGHFVSGHVDGTGRIQTKKPEANAVYYEIEVPDELLRYIVHKGSITVDGTSLTVFGVTDKTFTISLIPHTLQETILGQKQAGDLVNIECDMLAKYIEKFLTKKTKTPARSSMTEQFLEEHGFSL